MHQTVGMLGLQWGDEGKGKLVHHLSENFDIVARYNGGNNAGHTIVCKGETYIFHLLPSGMLHIPVTGVIGSGTVIHPRVLLEEIDSLQSNGCSVDGRLFISQHAHLIFPYHLLIDEQNELSRSEKIGTTKRGIGPCYTDKSAREGIRVGEMLNETIFIAMLREKLEQKCSFLEKNFQFTPQWNISDILEEYSHYARRLTRYITDTSQYLNEALKKQKRILLESAQGTMLDVDFGTYPFVTSCSSVIGGACTGLGIPPQSIGQVTGIFKAYTTRVGEGPFPTEIFTPEGSILLQQGREYGSTTGRPRRCGWIDLPSLKYAIMINGVDRLAMMKLDVLDSLDYIHVCTKYLIKGHTVHSYPSTIHEFENLEPVYDLLPGWSSSTRECRCFEDLPQKARNYIHYIEEQLEKPVEVISVGPDRKETIEK